jgi:arginase
LRVLWLDAHADCNSRRTSPSANLHGMPLACLRGVGPAALTQLSGTVPALAADAVRQIGVRSVDPGEVALVHELGLTVFDMPALHTLGMREVMARALAGLDEHTHLHLSFDVDFLDPGLAPGVATTVRNGASLQEARLCMQLVAASGRLGSLEVVELNPLLDQHQRTAVLAVELLATALGTS